MEINACRVHGSNMNCGGLKYACPSLKDFIPKNGQTETQIVDLLLQTPTVRQRLRGPRIKNPQLSLNSNNNL